MINRIKEMLQSENYSMSEEKDTISIHHKERGKINEEKYIVVKKNRGYYDVLLVTKNDQKIMVTNDDKSFIEVCVVFLCKKQFERPKTDPKTTQELRKSVEEKDIEKVEKVLEENLNGNYYSISKENYNKISLIRKGAKADVKFKGRLIADGAKLSRAYIMLFNYTKMLENFEEVFESLKERYEIQNMYKRLLALYIF